MSKRQPRRRKARRVIADHPDRQGKGRYSTLTNEKAVRIVEALEGGAHDEVACEHAGVPVRTFYAWLDRGEKELERIIAAEQTTTEEIKPLPAELPFIQFLHAVQVARSTAELSALRSVRRAWTSDWRSAIAFIERRHRGRWRKSFELASDPDNPLVDERVRIYVPSNGRGPVGHPSGPAADKQKTWR